jgi:prepilin peptidase CpaA
MGRRTEVALKQLSEQVSAYVGSVSAGEAVGVLCHAGLLVVLLLICRSDIRHRRVDNRLILLVALLGFVTVIVGERAWGALNLVMIGSAFLLLGIVWQARVIGGADAKLILACLVWISPGDAALYVILIAALGALLGVAVLAAQRLQGAVMRQRILSRDRGRFFLRVMAWRDLLLGKDATVPYAVAIAAAQIIMTTFSINN